MKKLFSAFLIVTFLLSFSSDSYAGVSPKVVIGEAPLVTSPAPVFEDGRVLVPLRPFMEAVGAAVEYRSEDGRVTAMIADHLVVLWIDQTRAFISGEETTIDVPPRIVAGTTLVPLRFVAEALGAEVSWDAQKWLATLLLPEGLEVDEEALDRFPFTDEEVDLLARLIYAEAGMEPYEGMVAVGAVVMNRIAHRDFPDDLESVIYQPGQFPSVKTDNFRKKPPEETVRAAREAMTGADPTKGALFFHNPKTSVSSFFWDRPTAIVIGNHRFTR